MNWPDKVCVIGAGKLGKLIVHRLLTVFKPHQVNLCRGNRELLEELLMRFPGCNVYETAGEAIRGCAVVVLAVRPQHLADVSRNLQGLLGSSQQVISVITGKSIATLEMHLGTRNLARASTSVALEDGTATTYLYYPNLCPKSKQLCRKVVRLWGHICVTQKEEIIDLTIVEIGAQVGIMAHVIAEVAAIFQRLGQHPKHAERNAVATIEAIARKHRSGKGFQEIVKEVRTKGGITAAGIDELAAGGLVRVLEGGIRASLKKTKELGG